MSLEPGTCALVNAHGIRAALILVASLSAVVPGNCEEPLRIEPGARIRVAVKPAAGQFSGSGKTVLTGRFVDLSDSVLTMETHPAAGTTAIPRRDVESLAMSLRASRRGTGAVVGLGVGIAAGIIIGQAAGDDTDCFICMSAEDKSRLAALFLAPVGALVGVVAAPGEEWLLVPLDRIRIAFDPGIARPAIAVTVRF